MQHFWIRFFDVLLSLIGILVFSPLLLILAIIILADSGWPVFFLQERVGKDNRDFRLWKFRTMKSSVGNSSQLTIGNSDSRITRSGFFLRKYKLDELPQLFNVLSGTMSLVGPRPEVRKFVELYTEEQREILRIRPGITDLASIAYSDENERLGRVSNPQEYYIREIMPDKINLNLDFLKNYTLRNYFRIIGKTIWKICRLT